MQNKIKLLIMFLVFLFILNYVNAAGSSETSFCSGINVCPNINPGNYNINCNSVADGFCPENYSKTSWVTCPAANFGKCVPCDPDCGICGTLSIYVQPTAEPCSNVSNLVTVQTSSQQLNVNVYRTSNSYANNIVNPLPICNANSFCKVYFNDSLIDYELEVEQSQPQCIGGYSYCYSVCTTPTPGIGVNCPYSCGRTKPSLTLTTNPSTTVVSELVTINFNTQSNVGIGASHLALNKWDNKFKQFRPVNVNPSVPISSTDYCSFRLTCSGVSDPVKCSYFIDESFTVPKPTNVIREISWVTSACGNGNYTITGFADDSINQATKDVNIITQNQNAPCKDECPILSSKTLNTIIAKVKTWIVPS